MTNSASVLRLHVSGRRFFNINFGFFYSHSLESPCFRRFNAVSHDLLAHLQAEIIHFEVWVQLGQNWAKVWGKMELFVTKYGKTIIKSQFSNISMTNFEKNRRQRSFIQCKYPIKSHILTSNSILDGSFRRRGTSKSDFDFGKNSWNPFICDYSRPSSTSTSFTNQFWSLDLSVNYSVWYKLWTYSIRASPYGLARIFGEFCRTH